jgi:hypothetical protein
MIQATSKMRSGERADKFHSADGIENSLSLLSSSAHSEQSSEGVPVQLEMEEALSH